MSARYLTGPQLVERLAISPTALTRLAARKDDPIPHIRIGNAYRIPIDLLEPWEQRNTVGATDVDFRAARRQRTSPASNQELVNGRKPLLSAAQVATRLGCTRQRLDEYTNPKETKDWLPHYRLGSSLRFDPDEVDAWLQAQHHSPGR